MSKIVYINACNYGSTGNIVKNLSIIAKKAGYETYIFIPRTKSNIKLRQENECLFGNRIVRNIDSRICEQFGKLDSLYYESTYSLIKKLKKIHPDIIHLHILHDHFINYRILFKYIKKHDISVIWTFHDCWAMTGKCPHFTMANCDKWKTGCFDCPQLNTYPYSKADRTKDLWILKKRCFTSVNDMTIVTPSKWLACLVEQSYLKDYPVIVINNGIDLNTFKPTISDFRKNYNLEGKFILLGVSFGWGIRKGLDVFVDLAQRLDDRFQIVIIGTSDSDDKYLPSNILSIHKTNNPKELAEIYTSADLFINPTREENFPTVNMESIACGTPVLTFNTGGSPEIIDVNTGLVVNVNDVDQLEAQILRLYSNMQFSIDACIKRAEDFDKDMKFQQYIDLYEKTMMRRTT